MANQYIKTEAKKWTDEDITLLKELKGEKRNIKYISEKLDRSEVSVSVKWKRLNKKNNTYNEKHIQEKYRLNKEFIELIEPTSILDLFSGEKSWYLEQEWEEKTEIITNDKDTSFENLHYNMEASKLISILYGNGLKFDIVDLDPFGTAYDCFIPAIKMAKKGLIITFGEMGHKRFKRLDFVSKAYGIETLEEFTIENIVKKVQELGRLFKKELTPEFEMTGHQIKRIYFSIDKYKEVSQWNN